MKIRIDRIRRNSLHALAAAIGAMAAACGFVLVGDLFDGGAYTAHFVSIFVAIYAFVVAIPHAFLLGLPYALLLRRMGWFRRGPMALGGIVIGVVPLMLAGVSFFHVAIFAVSGLGGAPAFHASARSDWKSNGHARD